MLRLMIWVRRWRVHLSLGPLSSSSSSISCPYLLSLPFLWGVLSPQPLISLLLHSYAYFFSLSSFFSSFAINLSQKKPFSPQECCGCASLQSACTSFCWPPEASSCPLRCVTLATSSTASSSTPSLPYSPCSQVGAGRIDPNIANSDIDRGIDVRSVWVWRDRYFGFQFLLNVQQLPTRSHFSKNSTCCANISPFASWNAHFAPPLFPPLCCHAVTWLSGVNSSSQRDACSADVVTGLDRHKVELLQRTNILLSPTCSAWDAFISKCKVSVSAIATAEYLKLL